MSTTHFVSGTWNGKAAGFLATGLLLFGATASAHRIEKHFTVEPRAVITIHNPNGKIVVKAWTKHEVMVIANHASDKVEVAAEQTGNRVDLRTQQLADTVAPDDLRADYEVSVPEDAELQIHDDSGEVSVANVLGDMNVETVAAGVALEDAAGYLTVKTVGGSFQCVRCAGRLEVSSISGSFRLLDLRSYHVRAQTSTGNILFDGDFIRTGIYTMRSGKGTVEVHFSGNDSFDLNAQTATGTVDNQAEAYLKTDSHGMKHMASKFTKGLFGTVGSGLAKVELSSYSGTIRILKRD